MPAEPDDDLLIFAHRLLCAAVIAHGDREPLLDDAPEAIDALLTTPEGLR